MPRAPLVGITCDVRPLEQGQWRCELKATYAQAVAAAGGVPLILPPDGSQVGAYAEQCDAFIFSGGADLNTEPFGQPMHPAAEPIPSLRQEFEVALLKALEAQPEKPVLGICMGMQLMALHAGGRLHQHLPEVIADAERHRGDRRHGVRLVATDSVLAPAWGEVEGQTVPSSHHQSVDNPGTLRIVALAEDGVVEAIDDPKRPWYAGVQWHPERGGSSGLNRGLFRLLMAAAAGAS